MGRNQNSELGKLIRGEGGSLWPTRLERRILKFSLDTFGEMLSQFLLTGIGRKKVGQRWYLAISFTSESRSLWKRQVQVITYEPLDGESFLPQGRDPLVLLALLLLLLHKPHAEKPVLSYTHEEVLQLLGWDDSEGVRHEIDEAIHRYSLLMYLWEKSQDELAGINHSHYKARERMISEYETTDREVGAHGEIKRIANRLIFNDYFIRGLLQRTLFDVDWNKARSVKLVTAPKRKR
ncbi:MAG: hypothetical protein LC803_10860 [Acidobacteria bacterium]|nr:hypothetical protein [Acidobacteriota bacterium]